MSKKLNLRFKDSDIEELAEKYIASYELEKSKEDLFNEFQKIVDLHKDFEDYLKKNMLNETLEKMQRNKRLLEKRKLFFEWYFIKTQNGSVNKEIFINLSEMVFVTTKTVTNELFRETTG